MKLIITITFFIVFTSENGLKCDDDHSSQYISPSIFSERILHLLNDVVNSIQDNIPVEYKNITYDIPEITTTLKSINETFLILNKVNLYPYESTPYYFWNFYCLPSNNLKIAFEDNVVIDTSTEITIKSTQTNDTVHGSMINTWSVRLIAETGSRNEVETGYMKSGTFSKNLSAIEPKISINVLATIMMHHIVAHMIYDNYSFNSTQYSEKICLQWKTNDTNEKILVANYNKSDSQNVDSTNIYVNTIILEGLHNFKSVAVRLKRNLDVYFEIKTDTVKVKCEWGYKFPRYDNGTKNETRYFESNRKYKIVINRDQRNSKVFYGNVEINVIERARISVEDEIISEHVDAIVEDKLRGAILEKFAIASGIKIPVLVFIRQNKN